jgi:hypothetical protein
MTAGVPAPLTPELGEYVCAGLREGKTLIVIANELKITRTTIHKWVSNNPLFAQAYSLARTEGAHALIEESLHIADCPLLDPNRARNMINARQWAAERRNRKDYGQSVDVTMTERVDLGGTLLEARKRAVLQPICDPAHALDVQDAEYAELEPPRTTDKQSATAVEPPYNPFD